MLIGCNYVCAQLASAASEDTSNEVTRFNSTLESTTATFGRRFRQRLAGWSRTVVLANEICVTCVHWRECLSYIKHERLQRAYNNYDGGHSKSFQQKFSHDCLRIG